MSAREAQGGCRSSEGIKLPLKRRRARLPEDSVDLLEMQRLSWRINFPDQPFSRDAFLSALERGVYVDRMYVYECRGDIVAWLWLSFRWPRSQAHVRHIQVAKEYWGRGIGRRVMEEAMEICRRKDCDYVTLNVTKSNERAMRLYRGLGFTVVRSDAQRQYMRCPLD